MVDSNKAVNLIVAIFVGALMAAFLLPVGIGAMTGDETQTITQDVGETIELQAGLNATLDSSTAGTSASYTIQYDGDSATTGTINEGANTTVTVGGEDVTVAVVEANTGNATTDYSYSTTLGWGAGAASLWIILPVIIVLAVFLFFVARALGEL